MRTFAVVLVAAGLVLGATGCGGDDNEGASDTAFVRDGHYPDGTPFTWFGFRDGDVAEVVHALVLKPAGGHWR